MMGGYGGLMNKLDFTCVSSDRLCAHQYTVATQRLHLGLVALARQQPRQRIVGDKCGALQHPLVVDPEHGDGRRVLYLPAQGVAVGAERCLTQGLDAGVSCGAESKEKLNFALSVIS